MPACILRPGKATFRSFVKFSTPVLLNETLWGTGTSLYTVIMGHMAGSHGPDFRLYRGGQHRQDGNGSHLRHSSARPP